MSFRPATLRDADVLYHWRLQDELTVGYPSSTTVTGHLAWLRERIHNPLVRILIWEERGITCGAVRVDSNGELAFHANIGCDAGRMLRQAAEDLSPLYGGRLKVTLDSSDSQKAGLLRRAGFAEYPSTAMTYRKET